MFQLPTTDKKKKLTKNLGGGGVSDTLKVVVCFWVKFISLVTIWLLILYSGHLYHCEHKNDLYRLYIEDELKCRFWLPKKVTLAKYLV